VSHQAERVVEMTIGGPIKCLHKRAGGGSAKMVLGERNPMKLGLPNSCGGSEVKEGMSCVAWPKKEELTKKRGINLGEKRVYRGRGGTRGTLDD